MRNFKEKYGEWALITGASSGLGAEFARQIAEKGLNLVLTARRNERLQTLATELISSHGIRVETVAVDLADPGFKEIILQTVKGLEIGLLVNNAGFAVTGEFINNPLERELELLNVNCRAPLILSHIFARKMVSRKRGGIIIVSSQVAFIAAPLWLGYSTSKVYDLYMACALESEMKQHGIDVQALCPGPTKTEFGKVAGVSGRFSSMQAETVIRESLEKLGRKLIVSPGILNKLTYGLVRIMPRKLTSRILKQGLAARINA